MEEILYLYDEEENTFQGVDILKEIGGARQVCRGFLKNQYQILSENGCLYYLDLGKSYFRMPTWNYKVKQIAANQSVTLILTNSGQLFGFGEDKMQYGLLGNEKCYSSLTPLKIANDFKNVSLSSEIACALDYKGQPWMWGCTPLGKSEVPQSLDKRFMKMCAAKDYVIFTDQQAQVQVLCDIFKLTSEYFTSTKSWALTVAEQIDSNYLIVTEILPNDKYSILLSNKNRMFILLNSNGKFVIRRLALNVRIHHLTQTQYFIYCFTEHGQFVKIDKANLYANETSELHHVNEQIRFQIPEQEQIYLSAIFPQFQSKYPYNLPTFVVDKRRFNEGISIINQLSFAENLSAHKRLTQSKLSIIQHQSPVTTPTRKAQELFSSRISTKQTSNQPNLTRNYYSPQPITKLRIAQTSKNAGLITPLKKVSQTYLTPNAPSPIQKSFISEKHFQQSTVKKAHLIRLLIQDVKNSVNKLPKLQLVPIDMRDRTHSRRSSSVHLDQVQLAIGEVGNAEQRNKSQEKVNKLNSSFNSRISQHDNKNTNASSLFQSEQDLIEELRCSEPLDMIEEEYLEYDEETDQVTRVLYRKPIDQDYEYGDNLKLNLGDGKVLLSRKLVNVTDEEGWSKNENGELKKILNQEPAKYLEEEILIENPKTGQLIRKIVRVAFTNQDLEMGEGLNELNNGQRIVGRRVVLNELSSDQLAADGWVKKETTLERILGTREPIKYCEEEILEVNKNGQLERKIFRRKYDKNRKLEPGQTLISSKMIDNIQSSVQMAEEGWECNFNLGCAVKRIQSQEAYLFLEEEHIVVQNRKQDRKLVRTLFLEQEKLDELEEEIGENIYEIKLQGVRVIARRIIKEELDQEWKYLMDKQQWEKVLNTGESTKYVCETINFINYDSYELTTKQVRSDLLVDERTLIIGENLQESLEQSATIIARTVADNADSSVYLQQQGWNRNEKGLFEKILSIEKIENFYEEEILIQNIAAGKQMRKVIRRPILDGGKSQLGDIEERVDENTLIVNRKIVKNDNNQSWKKNNLHLEKIIIQNEPVEFVEEEVLVFNQQSGTVTRQFVRRPAVNKDKITLGCQLKEVDKDGNMVVKRAIVPNLKLLGSEWVRGSMGSYRQTIAEEPEEYVEEEIIVTKNGQQERRLVRRPFNQEELGKNYSENLDELTNTGERIVARRVVGNDQSKEQIEKEGWKLNDDGNLEIKFIEPSEYIVEELLCLNQGTGNYERRMIKRPLTKQDAQLKMGESINEVDKNGNKVLSRQIRPNSQSRQQQKQEGWSEKNGVYERVISIQEPEKYIEEEVLIINPKTGCQERKLIRKPYNNQQLNLGENLSEEHNGVKVVSRRIVANDQSSEALKSEKWVRNSKGHLEMQISKAEPLLFIEEEILQYNEETGLMERKLVRHQYNPARDGKLEMGIKLQEFDANGNRIVSRKVVENSKSLKANSQEGWQQQSNGEQVKIISTEEPEAFIEEEVLVINPKTGKQERKIIRKPYNNEQDLEIGEQINEIQNGQRIVARKIVQNNQSMYTGNNWNEKKLEVVISEEPTKYIEEEILVKDKNGQFIRQKVRIPYNSSLAQKQGNVHEKLPDGSIVLSRKVIDNTFSQAELQKWSNNQDGKLVQVISKNEPQQFIEEEILILNPKTGKQERKLIRRPYGNSEEVLGEELNESIDTNTRVVGRRIVQNDHCSDDWVVRGTSLEQVICQSEPIKYIEEEILVRNKQTGQLERKLIRRPLTKDAKLGDCLNEQIDGVTILSRKVVDNLSKKGWTQQGNTLEKILNANEVEEYIEDEIIIVNQKTGKQERRLVRRNVDEPAPKVGIVVDSKRVKNTETSQQQSQWVKENGRMVKVIAKNEPSKMVVEEVLQYNEDTGLIERKLIKRPYDPNKKQEISDQLNEQNGNLTVLSRKIVDNLESLEEGKRWTQKNGQLEQILECDEPENYLEEEIVVINSKTGKQERRLIRKPFNSDEDIGEQLNEALGNGKKVVARRVVPNNQSLDTLHKQGWKKNGDVMEMQLCASEPTKFIEEEVLIINQNQLQRTLIRREYEPCQVGEVNEFDKNGNRIVSRKVVENVSQDGWQRVEGTLRKVVSVEPVRFIEEEILIINAKTGKQERRLVRKPWTEDPGELGDSLNLTTEEGYKLVSRKVVENNSVVDKTWTLVDGVQVKKLGVEPTKYIEEEVLIFNPKTEMMERKLIKRPFNPSMKLGEINTHDNQGNLVLFRQVVENNQSLAKQKWQPGQSEILIQEEPAQFIEEEVIVVNPKTGKQERKLIRRPYTGQDLDLGDDLDEEIQKGEHVVARRIVNNEFSLKQLKEWKKEGDNLILMLNSNEAAEYVEEEVLVRNPETGMMERKIIRREQSQVHDGKVINRKNVDNRKSSIIISQQGWKKNNAGMMEVIVGEEPEQYIEEEVIVINPKTGKQDRKLVRRPYFGEDVQVGDELNESIGGGQRVVARRIVDNDAQVDWEKKNNQYELKIATAEPAKLIEEEIVFFNPQTGLVETKIIRRPYAKNLKLGQVIEQSPHGVVLSRKVVENLDSQKVIQSWQRQEDGSLLKLISSKKPERFIEEEVIVMKNGKQDRKLIRRPLLYDEQFEEQQDSEGLVVSRKVVASDGDKDFKLVNGVYEKIIGKNEPTQYIEEEILVYNEETGQMQRKLVRRPFSQGQREEDEHGNKVLATKIIENNQPLSEMQDWATLPNGVREMILSIEPQQYYEEEILVTKNGKAERKIVRRPYDGKLPTGENLNEGNDKIKVLSRKLIQNEMTREEKQVWNEQPDGRLERVISQGEALKFVEEEVLSFKNGVAERKLVRRPYLPKDASLKQGSTLQEVDAQGNVIVARRIVDNTLTDSRKKQWTQDKNGKLERVIGQEPMQFIEEEVIVITNNKQDRKLIRKPFNGEDIQIGEDLCEVKGNQKVVARRLVDNRQSLEEMSKWQKKGNQFEIILFKGEPSQLVVEEILVYNDQKGVLERKFITHSIDDKPNPKAKVLSRKVIDNLRQGLIGEEVIGEEPEQYIEEEVLIVNPKTGKQERKLVRKPYFGENMAMGEDIDEMSQKGERIISRRIVQNEESLESLQQWKQHQDGTLSKVITSNEPTKYLEEEVLVLNRETGKMDRKLIRKPFNASSKVGIVKETDEEGNIVVSRKVVDNKQSQNKWTVRKDGKLEQVISASEPAKYLEEESLTLKQSQIERRILRKPFQEDDMQLETGISLNESKGNSKIVARRIAPNEYSLEQIQKEGWIKKNNTLELITKEPVKYTQEEILVTTEDGQLIRKLIRKPIDPKLKQGNNLQETDKNGNKILCRVIVENNQSLASLQEEGWNIKTQEKIISQEPIQYIEEEIIISNSKTGKQDRKFIRKPYYNEDVQIGDQLNEVEGGKRILARKIVDNEHSLDQLNSEGWQRKNGNLEITISESSQLVEEEILVYNEESGLYERKLVRRQFDATRDSSLQLGDVKELDVNGNKILSRKLIENSESTSSMQKSGWIKIQDLLEKTLNHEEPDKFVEEEILIINPKTGKLERKLTRRPYQPGDEKMLLGESILDSEGNKKVVSRIIVENDLSSEFQLKQGWKEISKGMFEVQLAAAEPLKYIEEEILIMNKQTKQMQRKLIRRQYTNKDSTLAFGDDLKEKDSQGNKILARRLIENVQSLSQLKKEGWVKQQNGTLEKVLSAQAQKFIEEEILIYNPKTGKNERKFTRKPMITEDNHLKVGEEINERLDDNSRIVARRVVDCEFAVSSWKECENGILVHQQLESEPLKYIEEEVLQINQGTHQLERKFIRRPYTEQNEIMGNDIKETKEDGTIVLSRKVVENNASLASWRKISGGHLVKVINDEEPEQYVEEEIITINSKTGKQERKLIRRPFEESDSHAIVGDQIIDEVGIGQKVISRRIVSNEFSTDRWRVNSAGNFEIILAQSEPIKQIEEEVLIQNPQTGMMERKLIRKMFSASAQLGNNLDETDEKGNVVISRRVVENLLSTEQQRKDGWKQINSQLELLLNSNEALQMVEEQILLRNSDGKQELVLRRRPHFEGEEQIQVDGLLCSRKIVKNTLSQAQLFNDGWSKKGNILEKKIQSALNPQLSTKLIPDDPTTLYYLEQDHILINPQSQEQEIHELRYPYYGNQHLEIGEGLRERDDNGNQIIARKIVVNIDPEYNPYQDVEEIIEVMGGGKMNDFFAIQKLANITEVAINKSLNERQPNGFIIRSRVVINQYQLTQQQGWRKLTEAEIPPGMRQWNQSKRSMCQIDEDSQEHRDSQYRSTEEQQQIRIQDQEKKLSINGKYVEEEILIQNQQTNKYERRLQRRYTCENAFGDDLEETIQEIKYLARAEVQFSTDLKGWMEISAHTHQRVLSKNETLQMIEEEFSNKEKHISVFILKPYRNEQVQLGEMDELQDNGLTLIRRAIINNRSLAHFKANDYIKNKDGTYSKQIKGGVTMKIPKFEERHFVRKPTQRLSQIQSIEGHPNIMKIGTTENGQDEAAIVNKTVNSDISETDKMFLNQLERGGKKDRSNIYQNILNEEPRSRINSDKNQKSPSTPFSECTPIHSRGLALQKMLNKFVKQQLTSGLNEMQLIYKEYRQKKRQNYQQNATNMINILANVFYRQSFDNLIEHMQKNVIEFNEDDVIKFNQMLDENKVIAMEIEHQEEQAAEPVELNLTPPDKKKVMKVKPKQPSQQQTPEVKQSNNKVHGSNSQHEQPSQFQRKSVQHNTMKPVAPTRSNSRASTVIKMTNQLSSQSLKQPQQRGSQVQIPVPYGLDNKSQQPTEKQKQSKFKELQEKEKEKSNSNSKNTPLSQSYATISQNQSQVSIQKPQNNQEQLAQIQKNKIANQFKRMSSIQLTGTFKKP